MTVDLARLRALHATSSWSVVDSDDWRRGLPALFDELESLRAEVERLRTINVTECELTAAREREAIVAWLRTVIEWRGLELCTLSRIHPADAIERGEHHGE